MYTVTLINKKIIVSSTNGMVGQVCKSRVRAIRMYFVIAGRLDAIGKLSAQSCIEE